MVKKFTLPALGAVVFPVLSAIVSGASFGSRNAADLAFAAMAMASLGGLSALVLGLGLRAESRKVEIREGSDPALDAALAGLARLRQGLAALALAFPEGGSCQGLRRALEELASEGAISQEASAALEPFLAVLRSDGRTGAAEALEDARGVLPFARRVVAAVPARTEEATMALITRFEGVRELSARAAAASNEALAHIEGGDSSASFQTRAVRTKEAIEAERKAVSGIVANNRENARKLSAMSKDLESGIQLIQGIEEITERSRLIAFNMAVEAAHIGEKGRGFKVIVNELRSLNDRTVDFSRQVRDLLGRYREYNAALVAGMAEHSERLSGEVLDVMENAGGAVESLIESAATTEDLSSRLAGLVVEMDRDLDGVLEALQFQDVTRQMLEGAMSIIADAEERLGRTAPLLAGLGERDPQATEARLEAIRGAYVARAKTKDEKTAILEVGP